MAVLKVLDQNGILASFLKLPEKLQDHQLQILQKHRQNLVRINVMECQIPIFNYIDHIHKRLQVHGLMLLVNWELIVFVLAAAGTDQTCFFASGTTRERCHDFLMGLADFDELGEVGLGEMRVVFLFLCAGLE